MAPEWYSVHKVKSSIALPDPHMPPGRLHHAILVQTEKDGSGTLHHVVGDITSRQGMTYETRRTENPRCSQSFHSQELLGYTHSDTHPRQWESILGSLPTPPQQKASNPKKRGQVEPFKEKLGDHQYIFYEPGEEKKPLWKCTEWTELYAIPTLREQGLIQDQAPEGLSGQEQSTREWIWDETAQLYKYWDAASTQWIWQGSEQH